MYHLRIGECGARIEEGLHHFGHPSGGADPEAPRTLRVRAFAAIKSKDNVVLHEYDTIQRANPPCILDLGFQRGSVVSAPPLVTQDQSIGLVADENL